MANILTNSSSEVDVRFGTRAAWNSLETFVQGAIYFVEEPDSGGLSMYLATTTDKDGVRLVTTVMNSAVGSTISATNTVQMAIAALNTKIDSVASDAANMFSIKGTIGNDEDGADRQGIPPTAEKGDAWRIVTADIYNLNGKDESLEVGDWIICSITDPVTWVTLQANIDLSSVNFGGSDFVDTGYQLRLQGSGIGGQNGATHIIPYAKFENDKYTGGLIPSDEFGKIHNKTLIYDNTKATQTEAGIVTLSDAVNNSSDAAQHVAATPKAVKAVNDALNEATQILSDEQKSIVKGIEVNNAKHSTDSQKILVLDEAGQTFHADVHVLAQDEGDNAGIRLHTNDTSDKVIVNEADHSAKSDVLVVEGKDYSVKAVEIDKNDTKEIRLQSTDENVTVLSVDRADLADDLGGRQETTPEEFIYQPTAGEYQSIKDGMASIKSLKGNSVVWNQYARKLDSSFASYYNNTHLSNITVSANNTLQCDINELGQLEHYFDYMFQYMPNHKYLALLDVKSYTTSSGLHVYYNSNLTQAIARVSAINQWETLHLMFTPMESPVSTRFRLYGALGASITEVGTIYFRNPQIIDLTQMFGEGNEPTTIEEFNSRKPKVADEYAYNEGEIISFNGDAIKSVGFNQWDEQWENGAISISTGDNYNKQGHIRSKNFIRVLPNKTYNVYVGGNYSNKTITILAYDENKSYIGVVKYVNDSNGWNFIIQTNCRYIKFQTSVENSITTYKNDICINLSHTGFRNGEYEPYTEHTLYLPSAAQDMKSAGTAYDEIYVDDAKNKKFHARRMGEVDLGDLTWNIASDGPKPFFKGRVTGGLTTLGAGVMPNMIVSKKYNVVVSGYDATQRADKSITWQRDVSAIMLYDYDYTDVESLKASLQGVNLIYELAEPIITEITDYEGYMDYPVSDFGTEEVLSLGNTAPLKADIQYGFNAVDTIRNNRLDITQLKKEVVNANTTADEAKSLAENAEQDASKARESTQVLGDHLNNVTFSGNSVDNGYNIELSDGESTNNPTMPNGDSVNFGSSITIPKATASLNGVMSKEDKSWLDGVKNGTSSVAKADGVVSIYLGEMAGKTIATLKTAIDAIQSQYANKDAFIRIRFGAQNPFITAWNNNDVGYVIEAGQQWVLQPIGYVGAPNYVSWILSSYGADEHYIVVKNNTWGSIRRIAFTNSKVDSAVQADNALRANNATIANNALNAQKINVDVESNTIAFPEDHYEKISAVSVYGGETPIGERTVVINIGDTEGDVKSYGAQIAVVTDGTDGIIYRKKDEDNWKTIAFLDSKVASADKADKDGNGNNIAETYAKDTDLDAIKSALTWKPFTISSN